MFPAFPSGATLHSILLACVQTGKLTSMRQRVLGLPFRQPGTVSFYEKYPEVLAEHVFDGALTADDIFLHHTVAPIYLSSIERILITSVAGACRSEWHRYKSDRPLSTYAPRLCPQCVEEDVANFGCGHWRREHQIRSVNVCTKHLTTLHEQCATPDCGAKSEMRSQILPGQPCLACHNTETSSLDIGPISEGYIAYCKLFTDALHMRIPEVTPDNQWDLCVLPRIFSGGDPHAFSRLLANWLGPQWAHLYSEWDIATNFLLNPLKTSFRRFITPSLILLAAFKRDMLGHPTHYEETRWVS